MGWYFQHSVSAPCCVFYIKFLSNSITSESAITQERAVGWPLLAASHPQGPAFVRGTGKILALLSKLSTAEGARGTAKLEIANHRDVRGSQVVQKMVGWIPGRLQPGSARIYCCSAGSCWFWETTASKNGVLGSKLNICTYKCSNWYHFNSLWPVK